MANYVGGSVTAQITLDTSKFSSSVEKAKTTLNSLKTALKGLNSVSGGNGVQNVFKHLKDSSKTVTQTKHSIDELRKSLQSLGKGGINLNTYKTNMGAINKESSKITSNMGKLNKELQKQANLNGKLESQRHKLYSNQQSNNLNTYKTNLGKVNAELDKQVPKLNSVETKVRSATRVISRQGEATRRLAAEQHRVYTKTHINNLNTYKSNMRQINAELNKLATVQHRVYARDNLTNLNTYRANMARINTELRKQLITTKELANAKAYRKFYRVDDNINLNTYKGNMAQINSLLAKQTAAQNRTAKATQRTSSSLRKLGSQTNYVNKNLWKLRGIILGVRTIFLSFGGIYVWQFFEEMLSATKETLAVKSEMEQFLKMNEKLGKHGGGIDTFNKGLDQTINKFKKLNKYTLGETVASIGKEFNLSAREMTKSMDVIAMVQSEYVRAGRKESEAALAVKDILQGEFRRLSMETGVGEKELKALGWSGDKKDVIGMMEAIEKAGKERHWDDFAKKATSLTDVFNILKNRMAEFGAELADAVTPMIVGAFNTMADVFDKLKEKYTSLSAGMRLGIDFSVLIGGFGALSAVILKLWKGFGLVDIAAVGFNKSLMSAIFGLNLADVRAFGFTKSLMGVITKTNAASVSSQGMLKSLGAWVLGLDKVIVKENGLLTAMAANTYGHKNMMTVIDGSSFATLKWYQKLVVAKKGVDASTASNYGFAKSIKSLVFNFGMLKKAVFFVSIITLIKQFADLATYMDKAKKNIEGFYKVVDDGKNITKEATKEYETQKNRVEDLDKKIKEYQKQRKNTTLLEQEYTQAVKDRNQADANVKDITNATKVAKNAQKQLDTMISSINLGHQRSLADVYKNVGEDAKEAQIHASKYSKTVLEGYKQQTLAYHKYDERLESGVKHIQEHIGYLKQSGADSKQLTKYAEDYDATLQETSKHWKKFWEGDIWSGASAILGELKLAFIDLSYNTHFIKLTKELTKTWESWKPTLKALGDTLGDLLNTAMDLAAKFLSTDVGKTTALWTGLGIAVGTVAFKLRGVFSKGKSVIDFFTTLGSKLKDVIPKLKRYGDLSKNTPTPTDTPTKTDVPTTTGGIGGVEKGKFWKTVGQDARNIGRNLAKASMYLASAMVLATEAILLLNAPMAGLAATGVIFKQLEPNIRKGIDGLKLIAPVVAIILPPIVALMVVMEKFSGAINPSSIGKAFLASAVGIASAMALVAEAIITMSLPLAAIAGLGYIRNQLDEGNIRQGIASITLVGEALKAMTPCLPIFAAGIGLVGIAIASAGIGTAVTAAVVGGIVLGMGLLSESILSLAIPLKSIESLGSIPVNLDAVNQGANVIKATGEALKSVSVAVNSMGNILWDDLKTKILEFVTGSDVIEEITKDGGMIDKIVKFNTNFGTKMSAFQPINLDLVNQLSQSGEGIKQVQSAIDKITEAMNGISGFTQNEAMTMTNPLGAMMVGAKKIMQPSATDSGSLSDYLSSVESIINDVNKFNTRLSNIKFVAPPTALISQIQASATFIDNLKKVVDKLQGTMQSAVGTQAANAMSGALQTLANPIGAAMGMITGQSGSGGYKSSIGGSLQSLEDVIDDLVTFNNRINGKNIGDSADVSGLVNFVNAVQDAIKKVQSTLSSSQPVLEGNANSLAQSLTKGFQKGAEGLKNIKIVELILNPINQTKSKLFSTMSQMGTDTRTNFTSKISGISDAVKSEMGQIGAEIDSGRDSNGSKAYGLGQYLVSQFKAGAGIASPGDIAKAMVAEIGYVGNAIQNGINTLPTGVQHLATAMVNQFNPAFNTDFLNFTQNTEGLNTFNHSMEEVQETSEDTLTSTNTTFTNMQNTINTTFDNIANNTVKKYTQLRNTTKNSLNSMQNQTTKNIGAIKTSWKGMQTALIASAEAIRSQTSDKISRLQTNMANFWNKIKNPGLLVSGSPTIRSPRRPSRSVGVKRSVGSTLRGRGGGFAGSPSSSRGSAGSNDVIKTPFTKKSSVKGFATKELIDEYLTLLFNGEIPYAGEWSFDWTDAIQSAFMNWKPNFPKYKSLNNLLSVADFDKSNFPVKGNAKFAKEYIKDAIEQTHYVYYYNSRHGNNPAAIWNAGGFNCWDGHILVMALASALGFPGGRTMHGMWGKDRHVWARIPGLGDIDSTAIQKGYGFTRGSRAAGMSPPPSHKEDFGTTNTYNIKVTVNVEGNADKRVMEEAGEVAGRKIIDLLKPSMATGR